MIVKKKNSFGHKVIDQLIMKMELDVKTPFYAIQQELIEALNYINTHDNTPYYGMKFIDIEEFGKLLPVQALSYYQVKRDSSYTEDIRDEKRIVYRMICIGITTVTSVKSFIDTDNKSAEIELLYTKAKVRLAEVYNKLVEGGKVVPGRLNELMIIPLAMVSPSFRSVFELTVYCLNSTTDEELNEFLGEKLVIKEGNLPFVEIHN